MGVVGGHYDVLAKMLRCELDEPQIENVYDVLTKLPQVDVKVSIKGWWEGENIEASRNVDLSQRGKLQN